MKKYRDFPLTNSILAILLSSTLITGCQGLQAQEKITQKAAITTEEISGKLINQGHPRTYYIYTPKSYKPDRPMPLVLVFHGDNGTGQAIADVTQFNNLAEQKGFIAVYPDGINKRWTLRGNPLGKVNDVSFTDAIGYNASNTIWDFFSRHTLP